MSIMSMRFSRSRDDPGLVCRGADRTLTPCWLSTSWASNIRCTSRTHQSHEITGDEDLKILKWLDQSTKVEFQTGGNHPEVASSNPEDQDFIWRFNKWRHAYRLWNWPHEHEFEVESTKILSVTQNHRVRNGENIQLYTICQCNQCIHSKLIQSNVLFCCGAAWSWHL